MSSVLCDVPLRDSASNSIVQKKGLFTDPNQKSRIDLTSFAKRSIVMKPFPVSRIRPKGVKTLTAVFHLNSDLVPRGTNSLSNNHVKLSSDVGCNLQFAPVTQRIRESKYRFIISNSKKDLKQEEAPPQDPPRPQVSQGILEVIDEQEYHRFNRLHTEQGTEQNLSIACPSNQNDSNIGLQSEGATLKIFNRNELTVQEIQSDRDDPKETASKKEKGSGKSKLLKKVTLSRTDLRVFDLKEFSKTGNLEEALSPRKAWKRGEPILKKTLPSITSDNSPQRSARLSLKSVQFSNFVAIYKYHDVNQDEVL